jgi:hypothetical protein
VLARFDDAIAGPAARSQRRCLFGSLSAVCAAHSGYAVALAIVR